MEKPWLFTLSPSPQAGRRNTAAFPPPEQGALVLQHDCDVPTSVPWSSQKDMRFEDADFLPLEFQSNIPGITMYHNMIWYHFRCHYGRNITSLCLDCSSSI